MKRKILFSGICAMLVLASAFVFSKASNSGNDVLNENVEALTISESDLEKSLREPIWLVWLRDDLGHNCVKGGQEKCIL